MEPQPQTPDPAQTQQQPQVPQAQPVAPVQPTMSPTETHVLEAFIPINRSGIAIAAGYVALFTIPFIFVGPIAVALGIIGLVKNKNNPAKKGKGRLWFAVIYGGIGTTLFLWFLVLLALSGGK